MSRLGVRGALTAAFLLASAAPMIVFWLWPHSAVLTQEMADARDRHLLHARNIGAALERYERDVLGVFSSFAPLVARGTSFEFARGLLHDLHFRHLCILDPETGAIRAVFLSDGTVVPERLPEAGVAGFVALADAPLRLSPVRPAKGAAPPNMVMASWVDGALVIAAIDTSYFQELADQISFGEGGHAAIVDQTGRVVAHPDADWVREAKDLSALAPMEQIRVGASGVIRFRSPALDADVIAGFAAVPGTGWGVMVPQPLSELEAKAEAATRSGLVVLAAGLLLSALFALGFSSHVARSLRSVSGAALRMARGDVGARVPARMLDGPLADLARLGRCFNLMADQVQEAREDAARMSRTDALTGLRNRRAFLGEARRLLADPPEGDCRMALFFVDIDRFKAVNDGNGHAVGDELLRVIAQRLQALAGPHDLIARQGGDEFLLLRCCRDVRAVRAFGERIREAVAREVQVSDWKLSVTASIGYSLWSEDADSVDALIGYADQAMYDGKQAGGNVVRRFDEKLKRQLDETSRMATDLARSLAEDRIDVAFQPFIELSSGRLAGFEALARWDRPGHGPVDPEVFVAVAERSGLISELGRAVRRRAFAFAAALREQGAAVPVAVNLSETELAQAGLADELCAAIAGVGLAPGDFILELTEAASSAGTLSPRSVSALGQRGFTIAIDDFGKGASFCDRLAAYGASRLKIDIGFAGDVLADPKARAMVACLVELGRSMGMRTTMEGVETAAQLDETVRIGADEVQGFWHRRPMSAEIALRYAREATPGPRDVSLAG